MWQGHLAQHQARRIGTHGGAAGGRDLPGQRRGSGRDADAVQEGGERRRRGRCCGTLVHGLWDGVLRRWDAEDVPTKSYDDEWYG